MAKVRRVIRKTNPTGSGGFDNQFWPVLVALFVLGGFLLSLVLVYLQGHIMFWPTLIILPVLIGTMIAVLRYVSNRMVKRSMQLALVISVIIHVLAFIGTVESIIFAKYGKLIPDQADLVKEREFTVKEYTQLVKDPKQKPDHKKMVETETVEPDADEVEKEQTKPEEAEQKQQPTPVPKQEVTPKPNPVKKPQTVETAPRQSKQAAKLSRQTNPAEAKTGKTAEVPKITQQKPQPKVEANTTQVERQTTQKQTQQRHVEHEPTTNTQASEVKIAKRQNEPTPRPESTKAPTLPREIPDAKLTPRTPVETVQAPAKPKKVQEVARPNAIAQKKQTTSPPVERKMTPTPDTPTKVVANQQKRQQRTEVKPTLAQTPTTVENKRTRTSTRPTVNTVVKNVTSPTAAPSPSPKQPTPNKAQTSPTKRSTPTPQVTKANIEAKPTPVSSPTATPTTRRTSQDTPVAKANPSASVSRQTAQTQIQTNTSAANVASKNAPSKAISKQVAPSKVAAAKQKTANSQAGKATATPTTQASVSTPTSTPTNQPARRQPKAAKAPSVAQAQQSVQRRRSDTKAPPSVSTTAAAVAVSKAPTAANNPTPRPTSSTVARQPTSTPTATRSQQSLTTPSASPTTQVASASRQRAESTSRPSINPSAKPTNSPQRAVQVAQATVSPTAAENPAATRSDRGSGDPSVQPARTAISKSFAGVAGIGKSANVDRALASSDNPATTASNSANRKRATQNTPTAADLAPQQVAQVSRSVADMPTPSATVKATDAKVATRPGDAQPTTTNATASAALTTKSSNAESAKASAAKGNVDVDLGPPKVVADDKTGRASGGGQQVLNFDTQAQQLARSETGGSPQMSLAATTVAEVPAAQPGDGGGKPSQTEVNIDATAVVRAETGGEQAVSGGPSSTAQTGPSAEVSTAELLADASMSRTEAGEAVPGSPMAGGGDPDEEDEEEKRKRLARAKLDGSSQLALSAPTIAEVPTSPTGEPGGGQPAPAATSGSASAIARADTGAGAPSASGPSAAVEQGAAADVGGGERVAEAQIGRAEAVEASPGDPAIGGGTASPSRSVATVAFAANIEAETVSRAGTPSSAGDPQVDPVNAQGIEATRLAGGAAGPTVSGPVGALTGQAVIAATSGSLPGVAIGTRQTSPSQGEGPAVASISNSGAPLRRSSDVELPTGTMAEGAIDVPSTGPSSDATSDMGSLANSTDVGPVSRQAAGGLVVNIQAVEGPGGLGSEHAPDAGITGRRARPDSELVQPTAATRFKRSDPGGQLASSNVAVVASDAFRARNRDKRGDKGGPAGSASPQTERAIDLGLVFLHRHQSPDGSWSFNSFGAGRRGYELERAALNTDTAATGLALLAFQGAGYDHRQYKYAETVRQGIQWLVKNQGEDGDLYMKTDENSHASVWLYSHSIAALALCEAYGMTQDPELREPAQKSLDFIINAQNKQLGGWRYTPGRSSDTSVTGWMMMALYSGELANLEVPKDSYEKIKHWLDLCQEKGKPHLYCYNPYAPETKEQAHGRKPSETMTSVGLVMRLYSGWRRDNENMVNGAEYLLENLPTYGTQRNPKRDTYYWYYATQVMIHMGGDYWKRWEASLHPLLVSTQVQNGPMVGSWNARGVIPDKWGPHAGRLYVTTMNLLSLEVQYRKMPLYDETAK